MSIIQRFFWWCAGADIKALKDCSTEHAKYFGIGGTIFFTAVMASFAGGYAIFTAFQNQNLAIFFGIFWGALIFNLDRYIVSSIGKGDGTTKITKDELINSSPRLLMAILLGFVVATPLELKVFEKEIEVEIQKMINEQRTILGDGQNDRHHEIQRLKDRKSELIAEVDTLTGKFSGKDPRISMNNQVVREFGNEEKEINANLANVRSDIAGAQRDFSFAKSKVNDESLTAAERQDYLNKKNKAENKISRLRPIIQNYTNRLGVIGGEVSKANQSIGKVQVEIGEEITVLKERNKNELQRIDAQLSQMEIVLGFTQTQNDGIAKQYNGFMARLEALDRLCWRTVVEFDNNSTLASSSNAMDTVSLNPTASTSQSTTQVHQYKERTSVYWAKILLTLMFIFIEIAPVLFKMMTEAGPYDDRMDEIKYESNVRKKKKISDINEKVNTDLVLSAGMNKNKLDAELSANESLLRAIADAQAEIAMVAIGKWKEDKKAEAERNPDAHFRTT